MKKAITYYKNYVGPHGDHMQTRCTPEYLGWCTQLEKTATFIAKKQTHKQS